MDNLKRNEEKEKKNIARSTHTIIHDSLVTPLHSNITYLPFLRWQLISNYFDGKHRTRIVPPPSSWLTLHGLFSSKEKDSWQQKKRQMAGGEWGLNGTSSRFQHFWELFVFLLLLLMWCLCLCVEGSVGSNFFFTNRSLTVKGKRKEFLIYKTNLQQTKKCGQGTHTVDWRACFKKKYYFSLVR